MTRATLTLELLAVLACACERHEPDAVQPRDGGIRTGVADAAPSPADLEQELDRLEQEIARGKRELDAGAAKKPANLRRNKSKNTSNTDVPRKIQGSGSGSS